jgi:hypothetical protein
VGATGATGAIGVTGSTGATGATGAVLPAALATGQSESGVWAAAASYEPTVVPRLTVAPISFPVPDSVKMNEEHVIFLTKAETAIAPGTRVSPCQGTLEAPTAPAGYLCVYTGVEELENAAFHGILKFSNSAGAEKAGALVSFERSIVEGTSKIRAQGTWAVSG